MVGECLLFLFFSYFSRFLELPSLGNTMKAHISSGNFLSRIVPWGRKRGKVSDLSNFHGLRIGSRSWILTPKGYHIVCPGASLERGLGIPNMPWRPIGYFSCGVIVFSPQPSPWNYWTLLLLRDIMTFVLGPPPREVYYSPNMPWGIDAFLKRAWLKFILSVGGWVASPTFFGFPLGTNIFPGWSTKCLMELLCINESHHMCYLFFVVEEKAKL